ncbi:unnamed protein product [Amoebophrya sp. A120]|nr:unnamed protein product [Amoebophrya sp. A120]|eukprot:GSA120T00022772001.1
MMKKCAIPISHRPRHTTTTAPPMLAGFTEILVQVDRAWSP